SVSLQKQFQQPFRRDSCDRLNFRVQFIEVVRSFADGEKQALQVDGGGIIYSFDQRINYPCDLNCSIFSPLLNGFASKFQNLLTKTISVNRPHFSNPPFGFP